MATQVSKLNYVDAKLGGPTGGQQTTRYIYDSVVPGVGNTNVTFFQNFAGKTQFQTNLNTNKLDSMESMIIKSIFISVPGTEGALDLTGHLNLNIYVGNQCVLKILIHLLMLQIAALLLTDCIVGLILVLY
jgi:hypothetical protein